MVSLREVEHQLKQVGCNFQFWGRSEVRELCNILMPNEAIAQAVNGSYEGGFAMLVVTHYRVLLVDRKPMLLTVEDIRYDMISEVDFNNHLLGGSVRIFTLNRTLAFNTWNSARLRKSVGYIQQRVMEIRQHSMVAPPMQTMVGVPQPALGQNMPVASVTTAATPDPIVPMAPTPIPGSGGGGGQSVYMPPTSPTNPYAKTPLLMRRRSPVFY